MSESEIDRLRKIGEQIRILRRQRGLSQSDLARRAGMKPGPVNAIENGRSLPSTGVLLRLARAMGVAIEKVFEEGADGNYVREAAAARERALPANRPVYSSLAPPVPAGAPARVPEAPLIRLDKRGDPYPVEAVALMDAAANAFLALEDLCGAPKQPALPLRLSMPLSEAGVENLVYKVRVLLGIGHGVIFDYAELFENAGLRVLFAPLPPGLDSASCYDPESRNAFLFVTDSDRVNTERKLFGLAREVGRIYCHTGGLTRIPGRRKELDAEHVASKFAAFFLMPGEAALESVRQVGVAPDGWTWDLLVRIKHRFGVSAESFLYRLGELDLITPRLMAELKDRILAHYAKTGHAEPGACRRILSPNGRLGDLLESSRTARVFSEEETAAERQTVIGVLEKWKIKMP